MSVYVKPTERRQVNGDISKDLAGTHKLFAAHGSIH